jgi:hypothetical protein
VDQLLDVKISTKEVRSGLTEANDKLQRNANALLKLSEQLQESRKIRQHISGIDSVLTLDSSARVDEVQRLLNIFVDINTHLEKDKFYHALRAIAEARKRIPPLRGLQLVVNLEARIPIVSESIKKTVVRNFNQFLVVMRERSREIGDFALQQVSTSNK